MWRDSRWMHPGTVDVAVLAPISTSGWNEDDLNGHIANVRQRFLDTLDNWPGDISANP